MTVEVAHTHKTTGATIIESVISTTIIKHNHVENIVIVIIVFYKNWSEVGYAAEPKTN
jgi:hypothetical protein